MTEIKIEFRGGAVSRAIGAKVAAAVAGMLEALPIKPTSTRVAFRDENGPPYFAATLGKLERRLRRIRETTRESKRRPKKYFAARRVLAGM
jgi:hypothetical protein